MKSTGIVFKILLLTFKCLNGLAPSYLHNLITKHVPRRNLRSARGHLLVDVGYKLTRYGQFKIIFSSLASLNYRTHCRWISAQATIWCNSSAILKHIILRKLFYSIIAAERASSNIIIIWEEYIEGSTNSRIHHFSPECMHVTRVHCATFYQSALRHELHWDVTPSSRKDSSEKGLMVVIFRSDLPVKRCEGDRAWLSWFLRLFLMQHVKVYKSGRLLNCDVLVLNLVWHFLAAVLPVLGTILKVPITPKYFFCLNKSLHLFETHCAFLN